MLARAAALLESKRTNTAVHLLCSRAEACPYSPALEQALAEAAEAEENWLAAFEKSASNALWTGFSFDCNISDSAPQATGFNGCNPTIADKPDNEARAFAAADRRFDISLRAAAHLKLIAAPEQELAQLCSFLLLLAVCS